MYEILNGLVNKMSDKTQKSEFLAELKKLEESNLIAMPTNLDDMFKDEKFTDLKSQYDKNVGGLRTKWDEEMKKSKLEADVEKTTETNDTATDKLLKQILEMTNENFKKINIDISGLRGERQIDALKSYAKDKLKDLPKSSIDLITFNEQLTFSDIDKNIELLTKYQEENLKNIDGTPNVSQVKIDGGAAEINAILDEQLGTKEEK